LNLLPRSRATELSKVPPKKIRSIHLGREIKENLMLVDAHWTGRPIDIQVGDLIQLPAGVMCEGNCTHICDSGEEMLVFRGTVPGVGRFHQPSTGWSAYVRVSRQDYVGRSIFRHLEDPDND
jgi:hypothetical protein